MHRGKKCFPCLIVWISLSLKSFNIVFNLMICELFREDQISQSRPFADPSTTTIKAAPGQGCPRCGGTVFAAEQQLAKGTMWHQKCFNCAECHRPLDSTLACDGPDKEVPNIYIYLLYFFIWYLYIFRGLWGNSEHGHFLTYRIVWHIRMPMIVLF